MVSPLNRFEALQGGRKGHYSIRINDQWRICLGVGTERFFQVDSIDDPQEKKSQRMMPLHPGEILQEELRKPMNLSQKRPAVDIRAFARRMNEIVQGKPESLPTRLCDGPDILAILLSFGLVCKWIPTRISPKTNWGNDSTRRFKAFIRLLWQR